MAGLRSVPTQSGDPADRILYKNESTYGGGLVGAWDVGCGWTATEPTSWGAVKAMFR